MSAEMETPGYASVTSDGFTVSTNSASEAEISANLSGLEAPKDGPPPDPEKEEAEEVSKAAAKLGEKGGKASAKAKAKELREDRKEARGRERQPDGDSDVSGEAESESVDEHRGDARGDEPSGQEQGRSPKHDPRARVAEATREASELRKALKAERDELAAARRELERYRQPPPQQETRPAPQDDDPEPDEKDFADWQSYIDARSQWNGRKSARAEWEKREEGARREQAARAYADGVFKVTNAWQDRVNDAREKDSDFDGRLSEQVTALNASFELAPGERPNATHWMADEILLSESAPGLMVYLSDHPKEFQRIASLRTHREVSREMAKLETRLEVATADTNGKPVVSQARPPVRSVTGSPSAASADDDDLDFDQMVSRYDASRKRGSSRR